MCRVALEKFIINATSLHLARAYYPAAGRTMMEESITEHSSSAFLFHHLRQFVDGVESSAEILLEWSGSHSAEKKTDVEINATQSVCLVYIESYDDNDASKSKLVEFSIRIMSNYLLDEQTMARETCLQSSCLNSIAALIGTSADPYVLSACFAALTNSTLCGALTLLPDRHKSRPTMSVLRRITWLLTPRSLRPRSLRYRTLSSSVNEGEVRKFAAVGQDWWSSSSLVQITSALINFIQPVCRVV